eukprot:10840532-Lingulodinium_polyedra.AAC.1
MRQRSPNLTSSLCARSDQHRRSQTAVKEVVAGINQSFLFRDLGRFAFCVPITLLGRQLCRH